MLGNLENELVELIKASDLGKRLRTVAPLPDVPDKDVIKRWGAEAPAAYVVAMEGTIDGDTSTPRFVLVFVARNARGAVASRQGGKREVGLYDMLDAGIALVRSSTEGASWQPTGYQLLQDPAVRDAGMEAGMVSVMATVDTPSLDPEGLNLGEFLEFHADYDLDPVTPEAHGRWADEDHNDPAPDVQSHINPQEGP